MKIWYVPYNRPLPSFRSLFLQFLQLLNILFFGVKKWSDGGPRRSSSYFEAIGAVSGSNPQNVHHSINFKFEFESGRRLRVYLEYWGLSASLTLTGQDHGFTRLSAWSSASFLTFRPSGFVPYIFNAMCLYLPGYCIFLAFQPLSAVFSVIWIFFSCRSSRLPEHCKPSLTSKMAFCVEACAGSTTGTSATTSTTWPAASSLTPSATARSTPSPISGGGSKQVLRGAIEAQRAHYYL